MSFKNILRQKLRTVLTVLAITVGSISLILMASIIVGIKQTLNDEFKSLGAFDLVTVVKDPNSTNNNGLISSGGDPSEGKLIDDTAVAAMRKISHVTRATPIISSFGIRTMRVEGADKKTWASISGFEPDNDVFNVKVSAGRKLTSSDMDKIVVGSRFVQDLGYTDHPKDLLGKHALLNYGAGGGNAPDWGALPEKPPTDADQDWYKAHQNSTIDIPVEIVGISESGVLDDGASYVNIAWARKLLVSVRWDHQMCQRDMPCSNELVLTKDDSFTQNGYSNIILKADDSANVAGIVAEVKKLGYGATTAQALLDQINQILLLITVVLAVIGGISLFVASLGIINTMIMATLERTREIGILRACGATRADIQRLFTIEAASLGFWGGVFGMLLSFGLGIIAKAVVQSHSASLGSLPLTHIGDFPLWLILSVIVFTTVVGMVSGLLPAVRASRLDPVEALRYE